jgi:crossover junction endodeoxyribonuclease RuvC
VSVIYLEKVHAMPGQGVTSMFKFGEGYGSFKGIMAALAIPYVEITPQSWQKVMFAGISKELGKKRSVYKIGQLFPSLTKIDDGSADALCMSLYGWSLGLNANLQSVLQM